MFAVKFKKSSRVGRDAFVSGILRHNSLGPRGWSEYECSVQWHDDLEYVKKWESARDAEKFVQKHSGVVNGLSSEMVEVVSL